MQDLPAPLKKPFIWIWQKDKQINEASFIFDFSASFYDQYNCSDIVQLLDDYADKKVDTIDYDKNIAIIVRYMQWIESIGAIIDEKTIQLKSIDQVLGYIFFIILNNQEIQYILPKDMLFRFPEVLRQEARMRQCEELNILHNSCLLRQQWIHTYS